MTTAHNYIFGILLWGKISQNWGFYTKHLKTACKTTGRKPCVVELFDSKSQKWHLIGKSAMNIAFTCLVKLICHMATQTRCQVITAWGGMENYWLETPAPLCIFLWWVKRERCFSFFFVVEVLTQMQRGAVKLTVFYVTYPFPRGALRGHKLNLNGEKGQKCGNHGGNPYRIINPTIPLNNHIMWPKTWGISPHFPLSKICPLMLHHRCSWMWQRFLQTAPAINTDL